MTKMLRYVMTSQFFSKISSISIQGETSEYDSFLSLMLISSLFSQLSIILM